jgi:DNA-binding transcriptional MerR regulator
MAGSPLRAARTRSIGEVINLLKPDFPDITVSKLRFLESQGLVEPARSDSGYRMFTEEDVRRVEYILQEQRDHYLPLKVIKSKLAAWEAGAESPVAPESGPPPDAYFASSGVSLTETELKRSSGLSSNQVQALIGESILEPMELPDGTEVFHDSDLAIARAAHRLLSHGLEARHLRSIRLAAERQTDLLGQLVAPLLRHRNPENRRRSAEVLADCSQAATVLQESMMRGRLRRLLER